LRTSCECLVTPGESFILGCLSTLRIVSLRAAGGCTQGDTQFGVVRYQYRGNSAVSFEIGPALVERVERPLSGLQRGLRAYETRAIGRVGGIF
jgi:hypothetical protein